MLGKTISHYTLAEQIGAGGMGIVYRAHDQRLDRDVALKLLPAGSLGDAAARKRFRNEALALARLNHPNIATVHDFGEQEGVDFLVMEYVQGLTLALKLRAGLPEKEVLNIGEQIARALQRAHDAGVIHGDLKPNNVIVSPGGDIKLLDFGLATLLRPASALEVTETQTVPTRFAGTLPYMAPEQLKGEAVDARCDIYSAGVVLYEMVCGRRPFEGKLSTAVVNEIINKPPLPPGRLVPSLSHGLEAIILKCLEKDPERRYQSARELGVDLRRLAAPDAQALSSARPRRSWQRTMLLAGIPVIAVAIVVFLAPHVRGWIKPFLRPGAEAPITSVAVLPLTNLAHGSTRDPTQDYLADGMTEALITELGQIHSLRRVISRTSVMTYRNNSKPIPEIGRELNVDAVVEGSVLRSGDSVEVTARLVSAATDTQLWSKSYLRQMGDIIPLQRELALAIANEVRLKLTPGEQAHLEDSRPVNPEVQDLYLKGSYLVKGSPQQQRTARDYFEQAIRIDPNYAPAYAGLAEYYWFTPELTPELRRSEATPKAEQYALKALELDPNLAAAHTSLGILRFYADWDWGAAEKEFQRAIQLNDNDAEAHRMYAVFLSALGHSQQAQTEIRRAQELDPLYLWTQITAGFIAYFGRRYDDAIAQCRRALDLDPNSAGGYDCLGTAYLAKGMYLQAIEACQRAVQLSGSEPSRLVGLGRAYALAGRKAEAENIFDDLHRQYTRSHISPYYLATLQVALGQPQAALTWLQKAYAERDTYLTWMKVDGALDPLHSEPGFQTLLRTMGFPADKDARQQATAVRQAVLSHGQ